LFDILDRFEIAASHASWRFSPGLNHSKTTIATEYYADADAPFSFVDFNTGVVLFRKSERVTEFFLEWKNVYEQQLKNVACYPANDQAAFRIALWKSDLRLYVLPPEYNFRGDFPGFLGASLSIIHGRHPKLREIAKVLGSRNGARVFDPSTWQMLCARIG
jgi:hypothetical protein